MVISVITPSYNQGRFLAETLESVLRQEGPFHLDYIVVDGGSTDDSIQIIKRYASMLSRNEWDIKCKNIRFRWVSEQDRGQTDALMKGFRMAEGGILGWLNSDDTYVEGALSRVLELFVCQPDVMVVYGKTYYVDMEGNVIGSYPTMPFDNKILPIFNFVCQPSVFFRKAAIEEVGGLDLQLRFVMDYDFWIRLSRLCVFHYIPEYFSTYRLHDDSKTMSSTVALANHEEALETVLRHYGWAPLNRVYAYCFHYVKCYFKLSARYAIISAALGMTFVKYLWLNKCVRTTDLRMLTKANIRKLAMNLSQIYKG